MFSSKDSRMVLSGKEAHDKLMGGVNAITDAIATTLGPSGRTVVFSRPYEDPRTTKDGYTVAKEYKSFDPIEEMGASMVRSASRETVNEAGDGTSTTAILMRAILSRGFNLIHTKHNPTLIRRAVMEAAQKSQDLIEQLAKPINRKDEKELYEIAFISANGEEEIANVVADAIIEAGEYGQVVIEQGRSHHDVLKKTEGSQYRRGFLNGSLVNDSKLQAIHYNDAALLLIQDRLGTPQDVMKVLSPLLEKNAAGHPTGLKKPVVILAQEFDNVVVEFLTQLKNGAGLPIGAAVTPSYGDDAVSTLIDIAIQTGGRVVGRRHAIGFDAVGPMNAYGEVEEVIITRDKMIFIGGKGDPEKISARTENILNHIANAPTDFDRSSLEGRLAKFYGSIVTIQVGGRSEVEMKERLDRVDDALSAVRCALESGIVPGGGTTLLKCAKALEEELSEKAKDASIPRETIEGYRLMIEALREPMLQICSNSFHEGLSYYRAVMEAPVEVGFNARTGELTDMIKAGVVDPAKVAITALKNASSAASTLMTADVLMAHGEVGKGDS